MKKIYIRPVAQAYHVAPFEIVCTSPGIQIINDGNDANEDDALAREDVFGGTSIWDEVW